MEPLLKWLAPEADAGVYNDWGLVIGAAMESWSIAVVCAVAVVAWVLSVAGLRHVPVRRRVVLAVLRALGAGLLVSLLLMPAIELRAVSRVRSRVAVMLDASRSMGLLANEKTRMAGIRNHVKQNLSVFEELEARASLEWYEFSGSTERVDGVGSARPLGGRTDIRAALDTITGDATARDLAAVLLYSDGADTEGLDNTRAQALGARVGAPVYTVGFAKAASAPDLAVRRVTADDFAFVHNTVVVDVDIRSQGLEINSTTLTLKSGDEVIKTTPVELEVDGSARVSLEFKPKRTGKIAYTFSVPVAEGEAVPANNEKTIVLKVIRDRIRILQVAGKPSWDERFLRELLKRNPNVDLISFFILRTPTDMQKAPQSELALIPFPVNELFTKELNTFDIVIYQNFSFRPYRMAQYLGNIRRYVENGGSFIMVGGNEAFHSGGYARTPIAEILPLGLETSGEWVSESYKPRLTPEGRLHPITRIGELGEPPEAVYERLPELAGLNSTFGLMPGAQALLVHPSLPQNPPVVAVREVGQGRTLSVSTDSLWYWRFLAVGAGGYGREFDRFWNRALRWLIKDPELDRVRVTLGRAVYERGEAVQAEVEVLGPDYQPFAAVQVQARLMAGDEVVRDLPPAETGGDGKATLSPGPLEPGAYRFEIEALDQGAPIGRTSTPVVVEARDRELAESFPRPELLQALAVASGGRHFDIGEDLEDVEIKEAQRVEVDRSRRVPIWDGWLAALLLVGIFGTEWWLRFRT